MTKTKKGRKSRSVKRALPINKHSSDVPIPPKKRVNVLPQVIVVISVLLLLVLAALIYRLSSVGRATAQLPNVPFLEEINLDQIEFQQAVVKVNTFITLNLTTTLKVNDIYTLNITLLPDGFIYYAVNSTSQDKISSGLLSDDFSTSGDIYLDDDASSDLNLNYGAGYLTVVNPHFVAPDYANVTLFNMMNKTIHDKVFYINKKVEQDYWFNISSTKKPLVTARWDNGTELPSSNFFETVSGDTFAQYQLNWTPVVDGAFALFVKAVVDDKETVRKYLFAVGSVVYALQDMNHPQMMMKKVNSTAFSLSVLFRNETDLLQPFSLPCGSVDLDLLNASVNISKVYAYDKGVQVWRAGVPSEFHTLDVGRGYVMRLKDHVSPLLLNVICSVPTPDVAVPDYSPLLKYPTLKSGWNLVGIGGYESLALDSFDKLLSAGKEIVVINETVDQMKLANGAAFKPGVAYWVKVN